jgi:hypothetical protein
VIYDFVEALREAGFDAWVLHDAPDARYVNCADAAWVLHDPALKIIPSRSQRKWRQAAARLGVIAAQWAAPPHGRLVATAGDVIVTPEYIMDAVFEIYPRQKMVLLAQNPFSHMQAHLRAEAKGVSPAHRLSASIGTSEINMGFFDLLRIGNCHYVPVSMSPERFSPTRPKKKQIAYMPRKRPQEAQLIRDALERRGNIGDYRLVEIDQMSLEQVREVLETSCIFISLSKRESIGFPAAEAMAAGCLVVGYQGCGGAEFFDETTGVPVIEDNSAALVEAVESAASRLAAGDRAYDERRIAGTARVKERYGKGKCMAKLVEVWGEIDRLMH